MPAGIMSEKKKHGNPRSAAGLSCQVLLGPTLQASVPGNRLETASCVDPLSVLKTGAKKIEESPHQGQSKHSDL